MSKFDLYRDLHKLGERYAGAYLINKFFIRIVTDKYKADIPHYDYENNSLTIPDQLELQKEYFVTLFHEYIHYVHEISTLTGITQFYFELTNRTIFAAHVNLPHDSLTKEMTVESAKLFKGFNSTIGAIRGGSVGAFDGQHIYRIDRIERHNFPARNPLQEGTVHMRVPIIHYTYGNQSDSAVSGWIAFGQYYLYEGLAHHLDQLVALQRGIERTPDQHIGPEYKMMEWVALHLFSTLDLRSTLEMASLALAYPDCGDRFIAMIEEAATVPYLPGYLMELHNQVHEHLRSNQPRVNSMLEKIKKLFKGQTAMSHAAEHLCNEMAKAYQQRMAHVVFELDVIFQRRPEELADYVVACDMVYELQDKNEYLRDFAGTYTGSNQLASDLRVFLCHMDFYETSVSQVEKHCCPLFCFCPHQRRREKPDQCRTQPRLSFEDKDEFGWCHYTFGVAYMNRAQQ